MSQVRTNSQYCWIDGELLTVDSAVITSVDPGLSVGLGVFDSLGGYGGKPFDLVKHQKRLSHDASKCGLEAPEHGEIDALFVELMQLNGFSEGRCRLRVSIYARANGEQSVVVEATKLPKRSEYSTSIISQYRVNEFSPLAGVKSTSYASNSIVLRRATEQGADEAIMLNTGGQLCEGATSNLFLVNDGELYTPPLSSGCLPGVTRDTVIEIANELGVVYHTCDLSVDSIKQCDEAFLTSSLREVQPIASFDGCEMPEVDSEIVKALREAYQKRAWH